MLKNAKFKQVHKCCGHHPKSIPKKSLKYIKGDQLLDNFDDICYPNFILCTPKSFPVFTNKSYLNPAHNCLSYVNKDFIHGEAR